MNIKKIGSFLKTDKNGYIIKKASLKKIQPEWKRVLFELKDKLIETHKENVHSIYVRGSVAVGRAIKDVSDLDVIVVLFKKSGELDHLKETVQTILHKYKFIFDIEINFVDINTIENDKGTKIMIKTQTVCIWGYDIAEQIKPIKPGKESVQHVYRIKKEIQVTKEQLIKYGSDEIFITNKCTWIMKRLLRVGCELVMEKSGLYTRDLYPCYQIFSRYYPEKKLAMKKVLNLAINPTKDHAVIEDILNTFGEWIIEETEVVFDIRS